MYIYTQMNFTANAIKLCSRLHSEIQIKLFTGEAVPNTTLLEKHSVAEMTYFKEACIDIIGFDPKKVNVIEIANYLEHNKAEESHCLSYCLLEIASVLERKKVIYVLCLLLLSLSKRAYH